MTQFFSRTGMISLLKRGARWAVAGTTAPLSAMPRYSQDGRTPVPAERDIRCLPTQVLALAISSPLAPIDKFQGVCCALLRALWYHHLGKISPYLGRITSFTYLSWSRRA